MTTHYKRHLLKLNLPPQGFPVLPRGNLLLVTKELPCLGFEVPCCNQGAYNQGPCCNQGAYNQGPCSNQGAYNQGPCCNQGAYNQGPCCNQGAYNQGPCCNHAMTLAKRGWAIMGRLVLDIFFFASLHHIRGDFRREDDL